jgi:hypothetical protein
MSRTCQNAPLGFPGGGLQVRRFAPPGLVAMSTRIPIGIHVAQKSPKALAPHRDHSRKHCNFSLLYGAG